MEKQIISWTPAVVKLRVKGEPIDCAYATLENAKPENYDQSVMVKYENVKTRFMGKTINIGIAYGEIDMNYWSVEDQVKMVRELEEKGWKWT